MWNRKLLYCGICLSLLFGHHTVMGQQSILDTLEIDGRIKEDSFQASRILIGQSAITRPSGTLEVSVQNRFWNTPLESEASFENMRTFIADRINTRFEVGFGITNNVTAGVGYATRYESFDAFLKYRVVQQGEGRLKWPLNLSFYQNGAFRNKTPGFADINTSSAGLTTQILIARKFTENFSFQLSPSYVYGQIVDSFQNGVSKFLVGFGGRYKLGKKISLAAEYYYYINPPNTNEVYGPFAIGVNWQVRKLILQFCLSNVDKLVEDKILGATARNFNFRDGNLHFGFQATYLLNLQKKELLN